MLTLILLLTAVCFLAATARRWHPQAAFQDLRRRWDPNLVLIAVLLSLLIGLRTDYNDTTAYIQGFREAPLLSGFLADPESWDVLRNPLFESYTSLCRTFTGNYHVYFMLSGLFIAFATVSFLRRVSEEDTFALDLFTYITLGTYMFALAAMKQTIAMAILALAVADLAEGKRLRFAALVLLAGLFHTYAFLALGLLLLTGKPWRWVTWVLILGTVAVMLTFEDTITTFLTYADAIGRAASSEMVFSGEGMNLFRVAVYGGLPPLPPHPGAPDGAAALPPAAHEHRQLHVHAAGVDQRGQHVRPDGPVLRAGDGVHVPLDHTPPLQQAVPAAGRGGLRVRLPPLPGLWVLGFRQRLLLHHAPGVPEEPDMTARGGREMGASEQI